VDSLYWELLEQVQSLASFCSTVLGTTAWVPCEVLKKRLQVDIFDNVGEAAIVILCQDGMKGFFRGTGATLCRKCLSMFLAWASMKRQKR